MSASDARLLARGGALAGAALASVVAHDLRQRQHALLRNFPVVGHFRYLLEALGPELRQYIVATNVDELIEFVERLAEATGPRRHMDARGVGGPAGEGA
jgi:hypothetical protein